MSKHDTNYELTHFTQVKVGDVIMESTEVEFTITKIIMPVCGTVAIFKGTRNNNPRNPKKVVTVYAGVKSIQRVKTK